MRDRRSPLTPSDVPALAWDRTDGLLPAAVQDAHSGRLLMLGYMDQAALGATLASGVATFCRPEQRPGQDGEAGGGQGLRVSAVHEDCDADALVVLAVPEGPTCHAGGQSCFAGEADGPGWLAELSRVVKEQARSGPDTSYTRWLLGEGAQRIAQKVGQEGVEVALAAVSRDQGRVAEEIADLLFHVTVLMEARDLAWSDVVRLLRRRHLS